MPRLHEQPKLVRLHKIGRRDRDFPISPSDFEQSDRFWLFRVNEASVIPYKLGINWYQLVLLIPKVKLAIRDQELHRIIT